MKKNINRRLTKKNIKPTAMRELVLLAMTDQKTAVSLPFLEKKFDKVDRVTLYRTLKVFEQKKLIHSIDDGTGTMKYALCRDTCECNPDDLHVHFHCVRCGNTYCLHDLSIPALSLPRNFSVESVNMVVKGVCASCSE
jgi:Fur family ferric uptake transcriptional regulator